MHRNHSALRDHFAPFTDLAANLLPHALTPEHDAAHDASHLCRVWSLATRIAATDDGDLEVLAAAVILHDCIVLAKGSPDRDKASRFAGAKAGRILKDANWTSERVEAVVHAIEAHSFSAGITPRTVEAMILQDADRLDAIGAIGVARCFVVAGRLGRPLYDVLDPVAGNRDLDDNLWTLDHFATKLLRLRGSFLTREGARIGELRHERIARTYEDLKDEIGIVPPLSHDMARV